MERERKERGDSISQAVVPSFGLFIPLSLATAAFSTRTKRSGLSKAQSTLSLFIVRPFDMALLQDSWTGRDIKRDTT